MKVKRLLLPLLVSLALPTAVNANLDDYLVGSPSTRSWDSFTCGQNLEADNYIRENRGKKKCEITISDSKMMINNTYEIPKSSIIHKWVETYRGMMNYPDALIFVSFKDNDKIKTLCLGTTHVSQHASLWNFLNLWIHANVE